MKELAVIILDWNGADDTIECLDCLKTYDEYDVFLVDNGSQAENVVKVKRYIQDSEYSTRCSIHERVLKRDNINKLNYILLDENIGFACGNNYVVKQIIDDYEYILCLNNDTIVPPGSIRHMLITAKEHGNVALTCEIRKYYEKDKLWNAGGRFTFYGDRKYYSDRYIQRIKESGKDYIDAQFITGCAMLIKGDYVRQNGLFSELFFHGEEDFNFCYKLKNNPGSIGVDLAALIYHKVGRTIKRENDLNRMNNRKVVHYLNRVIDFKHMYSRPLWKIWRCMYLSLLLMHFSIEVKSLKMAGKLVERIKNLSDSANDVKKDLFVEIMAGNWMKG